MSPTRKPSRAAFVCRRVGALPAGPVAALAMASDDGGGHAFAATSIGLSHLSLGGRDTGAGWVRLADAPLGILSLAASPAFARDRTLAAGTAAGLFLSRDGGQSWRASPLPTSATAVAVPAVAFSPAFADDGVVLAGSAEDGVLISRDRGATWRHANFGLLDALVFSLAFSPCFATDELIFAGADTALYQTYNGARAWKVLDLPEEACPVLSLLASPAFSEDGTVYAGTANAGLYCSTDRGAHWARMDLPAESINALAAMGSRGLLAATPAGLFESRDGGQTWHGLIDGSDMIALAGAGDAAVAGSADGGAWLRQSARRSWRAIPAPVSRSVAGLTLSPDFETDDLAFMYGPREAVWRSMDGGAAWTSLADALGEADVQSLASAPHRQLAAATPSGVWVSADAGDTWRCALEAGADAVSFDRDGRLAAACADGHILTSADLGHTWDDVGVPWPRGTRVLALALDADHALRAATYGAAESVLQVWQGHAGNLSPVLNEAQPHAPIVCLWSPHGTFARPWFASIGADVWRFDAGQARAAQRLPAADDNDNHAIVALAGYDAPGGAVCYACTGRRLYELRAGAEWAPLHDFEDAPALGFALAPGFPARRGAYVLRLGGTLCRLALP